MSKEYLCIRECNGNMREHKTIIGNIYKDEPGWPTCLHGHWENSTRKDLGICLMNSADLETHFIPMDREFEYDGRVYMLTGEYRPEKEDEIYINPYYSMDPLRSSYNANPTRKTFILKPKESTMNKLAENETLTDIRATIAKFEKVMAAVRGELPAKESINIPCVFCEKHIGYGKNCNGCIIKQKTGLSCISEGGLLEKYAYSGNGIHTHLSGVSIHIATYDQQAEAIRIIGNFLDHLRKWEKEILQKIEESKRPKIEAEMGEFYKINTDAYIIINTTQGTYIASNIKTGRAWDSPIGIKDLSLDLENHNAVKITPAEAGRYLMEERE